jgi:hypothetical protein
MNTPKTVALSLGLLAFATALPAGAAGQPATLAVAKSRTQNVATLPGAVGPDVVGPRVTEIQKPKRRGGSPLRLDPANGASVPLAAGAGTPTSSGKRAKSNPEVFLSFEGVNHRNQRFASGGNQFSGEPADLGLCVGNGYVLETVNSALRVFSASTGAALTPAISLNEFYGFPPAIDRTTFTFGPFTFDVGCHYDPDSDRWFHLAVDLDQDPATGDFTGRNYLDLAVSQTGDPTGQWNVYRIPGINDGSEGTPDHDCPGGPCFADFPHIGVDRNGVYITTNEFPLFDAGFIGAQVYAISKAALVRGDANLNVLLFNTADPPYLVDGALPGFTLWPALSAGRQFAGARGGSQFFVSSLAVFTEDGSSDELVVWALDNTKALDGNPAAVRLTSTVVPSVRYAVPPPSAQKPGTIPYGELFEGATAPGPIDTSDSRVLDARYANGKLWAVLGTAARVEGEDRAGVAWFVLNPSVNAQGVSATMQSQGILALTGESLAYPTLGVTPSGRGVLGFTRVGENLHPSAGYASIDAVAGVGEVKMIREGRAPQDGFSQYGSRPRWGDYGAAAVDGNQVYISSQYIEQPPCTVAQFIASNFSCGGFRSQLANWSTRVTALTP